MTQCAEDTIQTRISMCARLGVPPEQLTTAVMLSIGWNFGAQVSIDADLRYTVQVTKGRWTTRVACDTPLDGLVTLWDRLAKRYPRLAPPPPEGGVAPAIPDDAHVDHDMVWTEHRKGCLECSVGMSISFCRRGKRLWDAAQGAADKELRRWGMPTDLNSAFWAPLD